MLMSNESDMTYYAYTKNETISRNIYSVLELIPLSHFQKFYYVYIVAHEFRYQNVQNTFQ